MLGFAFDFLPRFDFGAALFLFSRSLRAGGRPGTAPDPFSKTVDP